MKKSFFTYNGSRAFKSFDLTCKIEKYNFFFHALDHLLRENYIISSDCYTGEQRESLLAQQGSKEPKVLFTTTENKLYFTYVRGDELIDKDDIEDFFLALNNLDSTQRPIILI